MEPRRIAYALSVLAIAIILFFAWERQGSRRDAAQIAPQPRAAAAPPARSPAAASARPPPGGTAIRTFAERVRCAEYHMNFARDLPGDVLPLLCQDRGLSALAILVPLLEAGDRKALTAVALLGNGGNCDWKSPPEQRARMLELARKRGATQQTLEQLDELLAQEQTGFSAERLATCRQSNSELAKARPGILQQFLAVMGRSLAVLRAENEDEVQIEYERSTLAPGDGEGQLNLAEDLLRKSTPRSQAEAVALLRDAAKVSPPAATELALCLIKGCPTPAPDSSEALELIEQAASQGEILALRMLAGPTDETARDWLPEMPVYERYAWSQLLEHLNAEGCFGSSLYAGWALRPPLPSQLASMSPADAKAAQARADALIAEKLAGIRAVHGCE